MELYYQLLLVIIPLENIVVVVVAAAAVDTFDFDHMFVVIKEFDTIVVMKQHLTHITLEKKQLTLYSVHMDHFLLM